MIDSLLSVGTVGLGLAAAAAVPDDTPPILLVAIPVVQLALVINVERRATADDSR